MSYQHITVETDGPITIVTLNRPEKMNALHGPAHFELETAFDAFQVDPDQWVAIITGAGDRAFCAGNDLKHQAEGGDLKIPATGFAALTQRYDLNKPVIAAVNGLAMGGGLEIILATDIAVAVESAIFSLPEPRVGLVALAGGLMRLPRQIGLKPAMGMILTGRRVNAQEARDLGFVNEVVPIGEALNTAKVWARLICECSPKSIQASKEAVMTGLETTLASAIKKQGRYPAMAALFASEDVIEGPRAFAEKRTPIWSNR